MRKMEESGERGRKKINRVQSDGGRQIRSEIGGLKRKDKRID